MDNVAKWSQGSSYGPILTQTDLYLLNIPLELHPILRNEDSSFHLVLDLTEGTPSGFDPANRDTMKAFEKKRQPATMPRVTQLFIITQWSPWCTTVNGSDPDGAVTLEDVCSHIIQDYAQAVTPDEFNALPPRVQDSLRRYANSHSQQHGWMGQHYYNPHTPGPNQQVAVKRFDWLRDRITFDGLSKEGTDEYVKKRLGFTAPNIFVMELSA